MTIGRWLKDHKTKYKVPAALTFTNIEYDECTIYISRIRNRLPGIHESCFLPVFVSWYGKKMSSSLLGDQFASFFQGTTKHNLIAWRNGNITATLVRKTFVSKVHSEKPELRWDHSEENAVREYFLQEKNEKCGQYIQRNSKFHEWRQKRYFNWFDIVTELRAQKCITLSIV